MQGSQRGNFSDVVEEGRIVVECIAVNAPACTMIGLWYHNIFQRYECSGLG